MEGLVLLLELRNFALFLLFQLLQPFNVPFQDLVVALVLLELLVQQLCLSADHKAALVGVHNLYYCRFSALVFGGDLLYQLHPQVLVLLLLALNLVLQPLPSLYLRLALSDYCLGVIY